MRMIDERNPNVRMAIVIVGALAIGLAAQLAVGFGGGNLCEVYRHFCAGAMGW